MISLTGANTTIKVWREPVGVVGAIVPWNFPFEVTINKLGQALATGNTVVLKPAPDTPFNATRLGRLIAEKTDIPAGVVNVVTASDHLVGEELTLSPKVDLISFTGSTVVGKRIMEKGAATMKRLFLELGGKSATIVLEDADFGLACAIGIAPCMHAGQGCANPTRMLLPRSRYEEGVAILKGIYENVTCGDPQDPGTLCGPVISQRQFDRVTGYIKKGVEEGATALVGGPGAETGFRQGILRPADAFHRCRQQDDDRPGGDLRPGPVRHPVRRRRGRDPDRQRQPLRLGRQRDVGLPGAFAGRRPAHQGRLHRRQRRRTVRRRHTVRRIQGQRRRPPERCGRIRPVHRDQVRGIPRRLTQLLARRATFVPVTDAAEEQRTTGRNMAIRYAAGLACGHLLGTADAAAIVIPLHGQFAGNARAYFSPTSLITAVIIVVLGTVAVAAGGIANLVPMLRWFVGGRQPNSEQRRSAMRLLVRQSMILAVVWSASGITYLLLNLDGLAALWIPTLLAIVFGGTAAATLSLLLTQRSLRPIMLAASQGSEGLVAAPGVLSRLVGTWLLGSGLPCLAIAGLVLTRSNGWIIQKTGSIETPILMVTLVAILVGLPAMIMTARSISDPVCEVVDAMAHVERGKIDTVVGVYEKSEIGRLQDGFNRMVTGIAERDRLRDLFGRHVGADVARRAIQEGTSLSGDVREAAILFIDLVGSTTLAATRPPQEVARVLNDFFRIVVSAVDDHRGLINKFQGDAVLAVFGAPLAHDDCASAALATARLLHSQLQRLPQVDFGIGVSAGPVFAGNIGAENRYEYTVVGDAVNEAARLADFAKTLEQRIVSSAAAIDRAAPGERARWVSDSETMLRGRSDPTRIWTPANGE